MPETMNDTELRRLFDEASAATVATGVEPDFIHRGHSTNWHRPVAIIRQLLEHLRPGDTYIDIGAGAGVIPRMVKNSGLDVRVIVVDAEYSGEIPVNALAGTGIETMLATVGVTPVPLEDGTADVVFAGDVIEHLPHSPRPFMLECKRLLRPGGVLVLETPNAVCLRTRLKMAAGISNWTTLDGIYGPDINVHHHKEYTADELGHLFGKAGFWPITVTTFEHFWHKSLKHRGALQTMGAREGDASEFGDGFNPREPYEYARLVCLAICRVRPSLRTGLLAWGVKPS
jgi:2-polyprenyl-3-methyl-5-hydroxy-6-metoxy-1,4-benzoquinol methylase